MHRKELSVVLVLVLVLGSCFISGCSNDGDNETYSKISGKVEVVEAGVPVKGTVKLTGIESDKTYSTKITDNSTYSISKVKPGEYNFKVISKHLDSTIYSGKVHIKEDTIKNITEKDFDAAIEVTVTAPSNDIKAATLGIIDAEGYLIRKDYISFADSKEVTLSLTKGIQQGRDYQVYLGTATSKNAYIAEANISTDSSNNKLEVSLKKQFQNEIAETSNAGVADFNSLATTKKYKIETTIKIGQGSIKLDRKNKLMPTDKPKKDNQVYIGVLRKNTREAHSKATPGMLYLNGKKVGYTIEPPWKNNNGGCIPSDEYKGTIRRDEATNSWYRDVIELNPKHERNAIQIHPGQWEDHTSGCILPGKTKTKDTKEIQWDISPSKKKVDEVVNKVKNNLDNPPYWSNEGFSDKIKVIVRYEDEYEAKKEVKVTAVPDDGWEFYEWTSGLSGDKNPKTITVEEDLTIGAKFVIDNKPPELNISSNTDEELTAQLSGIAKDENKNIATIKIDWGDNTSSTINSGFDNVETSLNKSHTYEEPGTYEVKIKAEDEKGKTDTKNLDVTVWERRKEIIRGDLGDYDDVVIKEGYVIDNGSEKMKDGTWKNYKGGSFSYSTEYIENGNGNYRIYAPKYTLRIVEYKKDEKKNNKYKVIREEEIPGELKKVGWSVFSSLKWTPPNGGETIRVDTGPSHNKRRQVRELLTRHTKLNLPSHEDYVYERYDLAR